MTARGIAGILTMGAWALGMMLASQGQAITFGRAFPATAASSPTEEAAAGDPASEPTASIDGLTSATEGVSFLRWERIDHSTGQAVSKDERVFPPGSLHVEKRTSSMNGEPFKQAYFLLPGGMKVGAMISPGEDPDVGFGLWLKHQKIPSFSWDWFEVTGPGTARKIQGGGTVQFKREKVNGKWELTSVRVTSDIVLRCADQANKAKNALKGPNGLSERWTCKLRAGTKLEFKPRDKAASRPAAR